MKGIYRQHQFDKVELVSSPRRAVLRRAGVAGGDGEEVLRRLELPYRVVERCTGDLGFSAAKGYDIEVWLPARGAYREISSLLELRRLRRPARRHPLPARRRGQPEFCHTLNGSGLAVGRTVIAVLENYQEADGTVPIPPHEGPTFRAWSG